MLFEYNYVYVFFINIVDNFWKDILRLIRKIHQFLADNTKKLLSFIFSPEFVISILTRVAVVHLNFRAWSTFPVLVCIVTSSMDRTYRTSRCNKVDAVRLHSSYRLNLLLLKGQRCVLTIKNPKFHWILNLRSEKEFFWFFC